MPFPIRVDTVINPKILKEMRKIKNRKQGGSHWFTIELYESGKDISASVWDWGNRPVSASDGIGFVGSVPSRTVCVANETDVLLDKVSDRIKTRVRKHGPSID